MSRRAHKTLRLVPPPEAHTVAEHLQAASYAVYAARRAVGCSDTEPADDGNWQLYVHRALEALTTAVKVGSDSRRELSE